MNTIIIFWAVSSAVAGVLFLIACYNLRPALGIAGSLIPFGFCIANGAYELIFSVTILLASSRIAGSDNMDMVLIWLLFYIPARATGIILALLLSGELTETMFIEKIKEVKKKLRIIS